MEKTYKCEECDLEFSTFQAKANHIRWHHKKPISTPETIENTKQKKITREVEWYGEFIYDSVPCKICGVMVDIKYRSKKGKKEHYYCSSWCRHSRPQTEKTKRKIGKAVSEKWQNDPEFREKCSQAAVNQRKLFSSKGEREIVKYFKTNFPNDEWTFGGHLSCKDVFISRDLYSNKLKVCIEYDGIWHFKDINNQLEGKQYKDKCLEEWCIENDYKLIRIKEEVYQSDKDLYTRKIVDAVYEGEDKIIKFY